MSYTAPVSCDSTRTRTWVFPVAYAVARIRQGALPVELWTPAPRVASGRGHPCGALHNQDLQPWRVSAVAWCTRTCTWTRLPHRHLTRADRRLRAVALH